MSWRQSRKYGKLLREVGIQLENEKSVRDLAKDIVSDFVKVEGRQFLKDDDREYISPYGRVVGLTKFVDYLLDSYQQQNMLTWHNDTIPSDKIWVKIGGDHGKNSLKFTLQIANIDKPNARQNTVVIAIAAVKDTHKNIERFLQGGLGDELLALQSHSWKGKLLKVFLNGDYDFLCKMYGLSGPQGTYPCLWCLMPQRAMHQPSDQCQLRSLESLLTDNKSFMQLGEGEKKDAAKFYNSA
ncbi:amine oxidase [Plakobranchus ocellatus]|uniref:Amine oxidase n=1 Tax=Plakobranchus ocellatus TaxID=259542 RepID=A0AAV4BQJ9_9GAST|nr:amine oxidase [Plakobranchus ocellatus]